MKEYVITAITNNAYEDHRLIKAIFQGNEKVLFVNNNGTYIVRTNVKPTFGEFVAKFNTELREENDIAIVNNGDTLCTAVRFCPLTKAFERNPKSFNLVKSNIGKNGFVIGDKDEAKNWLVYTLSNGGLTIDEANIVQTECWDNGHDQKIIVHYAVVIATVTDCNKVTNLLVKGIGNEKHLGLGMLLL
jgi:hypothetical protein